MALYRSPQREPLLDSQLQAVLNQRGKELLGLLLLAVSFALALTLGSYSDQDPSWMTSSDGPVNNALGHLGAAIAAPVTIIAGRAGWGLVLALAVWGLRLMLHKGEETILARMVFLPIAVAISAVWLAALVPGAGWNADFGLGGMFGDTILGALLTALPVSTSVGFNVLTLCLFGATLLIAAYVLGVTAKEGAAIGRLLLSGVVLSYAGFLALMGRGLSGALGMAASATQRRTRDWAPDAPYPAPQPMGAGRVLRAEPLIAPNSPIPPAPRDLAPRSTAAPDYPAPPADPGVEGWQEPARQGLLARVSSLGRWRPEPELIAQPLAPEPAQMPSADRVRNRIADAIRARSRQGQVMRFDAAQPQPVPQAPAPLPQARIEPLLRQPAPVAPRAAAPQMPQRPAPSPLPALIEDDFDTDLDPDLDDFDIAPAPAPRSDGVYNRRVVQPAARKAPAPSRRAQSEAQPRLPFDDRRPAYELPPLSLLADPGRIERFSLSDEALEENARMLESVLDDYGVRGEIVAVRPGPVVTLYELEPAPGLKASRVIGLADDIARSMSALSARVSTVPGRSVIGIELPNSRREKVVLREILGSRDFGDSLMRLPLALGKDIGGEPIVANLAKMPHLLIAGTTGSGKSVAINTMILSLLYKLTPEECRLIMIDPKMLELSVYDGIPHLLSPVVTDPKKAVVALKWVVGEMEERYRKMSKMGVRNIDGFNGRVREALERGEMFKRTVQTGFDDETGDPIFETEEFAPEVLPYIVVIVDEMADLMMVAGKEIEACIQRLAQMARASGIHLIMATQRPSVDVITGTIKANFPTRISFQVTSKIDSRTILGEQGAEQLLGMGDMLYMAGGAKITRIHGPFVSDEEVEEIVTHLKSYGPPAYQSGVLDAPDSEREADIDAVLGLGGGEGGDDALYDQAVAIVAKDRKCSTSYIQRKLGIGYNKAARLVEQMEDEGVVSRANHVGKREILVPEA